MLAHGSPQVYP